MEIDDILATITHHGPSDPLSDSSSSQSDYALLTKFWVAERSAPDLLPWPTSLMDRINSRISSQIEKIEDLASSAADTAAGGGAGAGAGNVNQNLNLKLSILQTDLSRAQYLLRSLIRQRLTKIEKFAMFYLLSSSSSSSSQPQSQSQQDQQPEDSLPIPAQLPEGPPPTCPLSRAEVNFLYSHQKLLARHFASSFLSSFPAQLRRLDDNAGGTSMVQGPDGKEVVFVRCLVGVVRGVVPGDGEEEGGGEEDGVVMRMGEVWVVRWESVRRAWERGEVEVL